MYAFVGTLSFRPSFAGSAVSTSTTTTSVCRAAASVRMGMSESVPFLEKPSKLDGSMVGDVGFDPLYFSDYIDLDYSRAAELKHGRICMLATLGFIVQELVHLPGPMFQEANPFKAIYTVPIEGWAQILVVISLVELATFKSTYESGADLGFDPMGMGKPSDMPALQLKELKNGRLAMMAFLGFVFQVFATGKPILAGLSSPIAVNL